MAPEANWAGSYEYRARTIHEPDTVEQLQEILAAAPRIRVLGSRHTFSDIADSDELVSLARLPADVTVDGTSVTVGGAVRYGELAPVLDEAGLALHNLASLPHISVAGAVATATHGSGDGNGNLASAVAALELVTAGGEIIHSARGDHDFDGMVVNLGALGAVTRVTLDAEPVYEVRQRVFEGIGWPELLEHYDAITATGYSVSVFTLWGETSQVWVKSRDDRPDRAARASRRDGGPPPDPRHRPGQLHGPARRPRSVVGSPAALPDGLHAVGRGGAAVRVPLPAPPRGRRDRGRPRAGRQGPAHPPGDRDPHDRRRPAVAQPAVRARQRRDPLHLEPRRRRPSSACSSTSRPRSHPSTHARTGASSSYTRRATRAATTSSRSPRGSTPTARSTTAGSNGM